MLSAATSSRSASVELGERGRDLEITGGGSVGLDQEIELRRLELERGVGRIIEDQPFHGPDRGVIILERERDLDHPPVERRVGRVDKEPLVDGIEFGAQRGGIPRRRYSQRREECKEKCSPAEQT